MLVTLILMISLTAADEPISLCPPALTTCCSPRGKPAVLISSTEHYGAVLNAAFDATPLPRRAARARGLVSLAPSPAHIAKSPARSRSRTTPSLLRRTNTSVPGLAPRLPAPPMVETSLISLAGTACTLSASRISSRPPPTAASSSSSCCSAPSMKRISGRSIP